MSANPEQKNYAEIERLERLLGELRKNRSTARETEAIREIGLEIAVAIREVGRGCSSTSAGSSRSRRARPARSSSLDGHGGVAPAI